ncbi:MAG: aminoglycoside phosphotransferase family protein [Dehalococcoidia bacterium]|nr:aminoglycoside phosphotransferase family protein [Dehalococcoidia bacterium]
MLRKPPVSWKRIERGYTPAQRWVVTLDGGSSAFLKMGDDILRPGAAHTTADGLRKEYRVYSQLGASFLPDMLGWMDEPAATILALEDLSGAFWPPPWSQPHVDTVLEALTALHATRLPGAASVYENIDADPTSGGWNEVARDPSSFLTLGITSMDWLERALPELLLACGKARINGDDLCHFDVRSDNICIRGEQAILIDWNWMAIGNGQLDTAFWLPSLAIEGGPPPERTMPTAPDLAAVVSGFFAARAGLPVIPALPLVRDIQLAQLRTALPWAVRALGLPPLDGPNAPA